MTEDQARAQEVDLAELDRLREEIDNRTTASNVLIGAAVAALGAAAAAVAQVPDVLLGLAGASSFLALCWVDHTTQIYKIAAYLGRGLAPRVRARHPGRAGDDLLSWERFYRRLDAGDVATTLGANAVKSPYAQSLLRTTEVTNYVRVLFEGAPLILLVPYIALTIWPNVAEFIAWLAQGRTGSGTIHWPTIMRLGGTALALYLWVRSRRCFSRLTQFTALIDGALRESPAIAEPNDQPDAGAFQGARTADLSVGKVQESHSVAPASGASRGDESSRLNDNANLMNRS